MAEIILITGGVRSGKTSLALRWAEAAARRVYIATAEAVDAEMQERIGNHQRERGAGWTTVEAPLDLAGAIAGVNDAGATVVIDCLTVWLGNLMHHQGLMTDEAPPCAALIAGLRGCVARRVIVVSNEVGMGIVPIHPMARRFRDVAGRVNQRVADVADRVVLVVCGQALELKPQGTGGRP